MVGLDEFLVYHDGDNNAGIFAKPPQVGFDCLDGSPLTKPNFAALANVAGWLSVNPNVFGSGFQAPVFDYLLVSFKPRDMKESYFHDSPVSVQMM